MPFWGRSPQALLACAVHAISRIGKVTAVSGRYESPAWPDPSDPAFQNACVALQSDLSPAGLLAALQAIEAGFGRRRERPNGPRTLDLDILDYHGLILADRSGHGLDLPHPRLHQRDFALLPLLEIAPDWRHPSLDLPGSSLIARLASLSARPVGEIAPA